MAKVLPFERKIRTVSALKQTSSAEPTTQTDPYYSQFDQLDGSHPWQDILPEACVLYPARVIPGGKVSYFNFSLAKEMGLIANAHPQAMNKELEAKLLETFCIRIVNEWDQENKIAFPKSVLKKKKYMATRYLQLQHPDKSGRTSGDGRCVWNGIVRHHGRVWDVSSRGTGVTQLAPGVVAAGRSLRSGNREFGYGCGLAEIDELYGAAIMAEIFHRNGIPTERVLAIVDLGKGIGIGVRAGLNLFRPAHLFAPLRQSNLDALKRSVNYLIDRQHQNGEWDFSSTHRRRYELLLDELTSSFAKFAAQLDREYVFAWLDWDGDNVLANAGIIDYGSVRQFGLRHDQYRYDDVDRFSTNLNEQRRKTRSLVQAFAQMTDYLVTGTRKSIDRFKRHDALLRFDELFQFHQLDRFLYQLGFMEGQRTMLLARHGRAVRQLFKTFSQLERTKTRRKRQRVADGVNRPAIFNMRSVAATYPGFLLANHQTFNATVMAAEDFLGAMLAGHASRRDRHLTTRLRSRIQRFQTQYKNVVLRAAGSRIPLVEFLGQLNARSNQINRESRLTGNALINIVDELLKARSKGLSDEAIQQVMEAFIADQVMIPDQRIQPRRSTHHGDELYSTLLTLVKGYKEDI